MRPLRVLFAGTPEFAVPALQALLDAGQAVIGVYTQPDRPAGRGQYLQMSPVKALALSYGLPLYQPASLKRDPEAVAQLVGLGADLFVVAAYGLLLPKAVLDAPTLGCINVHASLLPRWRGAAPIQRAILAGDTQTGVSIMRMEEGLDTGPVYHRITTPIAPDETGQTLHDRLAALGAQALLEALPRIADGSLVPEPQDEAQTTYAPKLSKDEARIDWRSPADLIERQIRAFNPWPIAYTTLEAAPIRLWAAQAEDGPEGACPGAILQADRAGICVATGAGILRITRLQPAGKRPMSAAEYLNARRLDGARFD
ncbi:methionyl-tRNA formyltransferase [Caldichromatium japonicum]|uniref:Methionyl-tRNA formyltransferase n=1 Tax=Caldichromatium japonicum TaxID=2699430 RepID=A0A6G7VBN1_9GAMM|nr:methionyl-tRNA formyltransferase [Caldichromatium japonicum]QIK37285.1 methionyl-tRNA formyltransferase [Caldichromatium japonicum]